MGNEDPDQPVLTHRLIWAFVSRIWHEGSFPAVGIWRATRGGKGSAHSGLSLYKRTLHTTTVEQNLNIATGMS